jgi:hypothetical protein
MSRRAIWPRVFPIPALTGALFASRARPPFRTETADDLDDRPACRANPTGLVPRTIRRLVDGLAAIRICCASRGNCCRRDIPKDAAVLAAYFADYLRSRRGAENDHFSVPVNGRPAPNGLEEPGGREDARAFEVSPADAETRYSAPQAAARAPLRRPWRNTKWGRKRKQASSHGPPARHGRRPDPAGSGASQPTDDAARCHGRALAALPGGLRGLTSIIPYRPLRKPIALGCRSRLGLPVYDKMWRSSRWKNSKNCPARVRSVS